MHGTHRAETCGEEGLAIFIVDEEPIGSEIVYVNHAFARMSGYTPDQLIGHSALLLAGARPNRDALAKAMKQARERPFLATERKFRPDGSTYDVELRLETLRPSSADAPERVVLMQRELRAGDTRRSRRA
jgi:PAS domain S-box-containing protein